MAATAAVGERGHGERGHGEGGRRGRPVEREVKLDASLTFELPDLGDAVAGVVRLPEVELRAVYFDTPDARLWRRGVTFRHRRQGEETGTWTLKLPAGRSGPSLDRTELEWPGPVGEPPQPALRLLRGLVRRSPLGQVAEVASTRRRLLLGDRQGNRWGELDDDTVTVVGGVGDGRRFRQIELELTGDGDEAVAAVLERLEAAGARPGGEPKLAMALGPSGPTPAPARAVLDRNARVADLVRASVQLGTERLLEHDLGLRLDPLAPSRHHVHQARVATRRLRSDLKTFSEALDPVWVAHVRADLKWLGGLLGDLRDLDVIGDALGSGGVRSPAESEGRRVLRERLGRQRTTASAELYRVLDGDRYLDLLDRLDAAGSVPPFIGAQTRSRRGHRRRPADRPARRAVPAMVKPGWRSLRQRVDAAGPQPSAAELHRIRIRAKRLRYASEAARPVIGKPAHRMAKDAEALQELLGEFHDAASTEGWLRCEARTGTAETSFAAGVLVGRQQHRQETLRDRWRAAWDRLARPKRRRWLRRS